MWQFLGDVLAFLKWMIEHPDYLWLVMKLGCYLFGGLYIARFLWKAQTKYFSRGGR